MTKITKKRLRKSTWNTYSIRGYTHDVANDQASAGGVHLYQIRYTKHGWQKRVLQSNGRHEAYGEVSPVDYSEGAAAFAEAEAI